MSCYICLEDLIAPVSLPCGHVFCTSCLERVVEAVHSYSTLHACPTCRAHYHLAPLNLSTVPNNLRPYLIPSIRKVYIDSPSSKPRKSAPQESQSNPSTEIARLRAEIDALRHNCSMWRRRAEVHSTATLGLLELSRMAKDKVSEIARERDTIQRDYLKLNHEFRRQQAAMQAMVADPLRRKLGLTSQSTVLPVDPALQLFEREAPSTAPAQLIAHSPIAKLQREASNATADRGVP